MMKKRVVHIVTALMFATPNFAPAAVIYVSPTGTGNGTSWAAAAGIENAVNNLATNSDQLWIKQGTYTLDFSAGLTSPAASLYGGFVGTETALNQRSTDATLTVIQSRVWTLGFAFNACVIDGFTLLRLPAIQTTVNSRGHATIRNCIFDGAWIDFQSNSGNSTSLYDCVFKNNMTDGTGAAYIRSGALARFYDCEFASNHDTGSGGNGGAAINSSGYFLLDRCVLYDNSCDTNGGAIRVSNSQGEIYNSLFYDNSANQKGGAIYYSASSGSPFRFLKILNSTFTGNSAPNGGSAFEIFLFSGTEFELRNSIVWGNTGSTELNICNACGSPSIILSDNLMVDPMFVDAGANNYRLTDCSPALNAGNNTHTNGSQDLDLNPRIAGGTVDIGCYEFPGTPVDSDGDGVPNACDICPSGDDGVDADTDGVPDACDNCPGNANANQLDLESPSPLLSPVAAWRFEEGAGTNANDQVGSFDGTVAGAQWVGGRQGGALQFDGSNSSNNQHVLIGEVPALSNVPAFTVTFWFKRSSDRTIDGNQSNHGIDNVMLAKSSDGFNDNIEIGSTGNGLEFYLDTMLLDPNTTPTVVPAVVSNGVWTHLAMTYDSARASELEIYINGSLAFSSTLWGGNLDQSAGSPLTLGIARPDSVLWGDFDGALDEVAVFSRALSGAEVANIYAGLGDGVGDACDMCPLDSPDDTDADGVCDSADVCPGGDDNVDSDSDGVPDFCDTCPGHDDTIDCNTNGIPDGCELPGPAEMFAADVLYSAGNRSEFGALGDLDADGDLDFAVSNWDDDNVSVMLNNGNGTFAADALYGTGDMPRYVAIGDLDGDGDLDLAVANWNTDDVSILLNNGNGTFADDVLYGVGDAPICPAIGDLDGDGDLDLAVANWNSDDISVLLNSGDGTFSVDVLYGAADRPAAAAINDLDGDGDLDLAVANFGSASVSVLLNNGNGTFADDVLYGTGANPNSVAIGDLNGDGDLDLVLGNQTHSSGVFSVSVLINNGNGTFANDVLYGADNAPVAVALGDLDGDSDLDLAVANFQNSNVSILLNNGNGTFADDILYGTGSVPLSVAMGDLDGDGDLDLALACRNDGASILLHTNGDCNGNGVPDECDLAMGAPDCNSNGVLDECEVASGAAQDCNASGVPDACELAGNDCNNNGVLDDCDTDSDGDGVPNDCDLCEGFDDNIDADSNGIPDGCDAPCGTLFFGDLDGSGMADVDDVDEFAAIVIDPGSATADEFCAADINEDGNVNGLDIPGFVSLVLTP
jgi:hypothetical protein